MEPDDDSVGSAADVIETLTLRQELLAGLAGRELERPALVEDLDLSRATVYRGVKQLVDLGLVEYGNEGYRLTTWGKTAHEAHEDYVAFVETAQAARSLLNAIPDRPSVPPAFFREATVVGATDPAPTAPGTHLAPLLPAADRIRALSKSHSQTDAVDVWHRTIVEAGTPTEFVFETAFYDYLRDRDRPEITAILESEYASSFTVPSAPFGLFILESATDRDRSVLLAYDADGLLQGIVVTTNRVALDWSERVYRDHRERATPVSPG